MTITQPLLSSIIQYGDRVTVRVSDVYPTDIDDLWSAVTDPGRLARWIATVSGDLQVGGDFDVTFTSSWTGPGRVESCDPPYGYTLRMEPGTAQEARMSVRLSPEGDGTRLVVEDAGLPAEEQLAHGAGWQVHLEDLRAVVEGRDPTAWQPRWQQLLPVYEAQLGRPAGGPRLLGTLRTERETGVIRLTDRFATDIDDLWSALTEKDRLSRWLGDFDGTLSLGHSYRYLMHASQADGEDRIVECEPPRRFRVESTDASETVTATLTPDGDATVLTIEHRGIAPGMLAGYGAGTQIHFEDLGAYLAGLGRCDSDARMGVLYPAYQQVPVESD